MSEDYCPTCGRPDGAGHEAFCLTCPPETLPHKDDSALCLLRRLRKEHPLAIVDSAIKEVEVLEAKCEAMRYELMTILHAHRTQNRLSPFREAQMRKVAGMNP